MGLGIYSRRIVATPPLEVTLLIASPIILAVVVLAACYLPARRAARIDPMTALGWL